MLRFGDPDGGSVDFFLDTSSESGSSSSSDESDESTVSLPSFCPESLRKRTQEQHELVKAARPIKRSISMESDAFERTQVPLSPRLSDSPAGCTFRLDSEDVVSAASVAQHFCEWSAPAAPGEEDTATAPQRDPVLMTEIGMEVEYFLRKYHNRALLKAYERHLDRNAAPNLQRRLSNLRTRRQSVPLLESTPEPPKIARPKPVKGPSSLRQRLRAGGRGRVQRGGTARAPTSRAVPPPVLLSPPTLSAPLSLGAPAILGARGPSPPSEPGTASRPLTPVSGLCEVLDTLTVEDHAHLRRTRFDPMDSLRAAWLEASGELVDLFSGLVLSHMATDHGARRHPAMSAEWMVQFDGERARVLVHRGPVIGHFDRMGLLRSLLGLRTWWPLEFCEKTVRTFPASFFTDTAVATVSNKDRVLKFFQFVRACYERHLRSFWSSRSTLAVDARGAFPDSPATVV